MLGSNNSDKQNISGCKEKADDFLSARRIVPPHLLAVLLLGIVSQVAQVLFLRELLMVFHGNEFSIGLILAAWLAWVGVGSRVGAAFVWRINRPLLFLAISAAGILLTLPVTVLLVRVLRSSFEISPGAYLSLADMVLSCFLLMAPSCLLLGAQFVLLSRVWRECDGIPDTSGIGKTYIGEAAGNMLGGLLFTFLMVKYLNSFQSAILVGLFMLGAALFMNRRYAVAGDRWPSALHLLLVVLIIISAGVYPLLGNLDQWAYRLQWQFFSPQHELIGTYQSKHGTIAILRLEDQYSFYQSGHLVFSTAGPETLVPGLEEQEAVEFAHMAMVQHESPERVLLIGGGLRGVLSEIIKHPVEQVDYVELDEVLTDAAEPFVSGVTLEALADPRVNLVHADGRLFVKTADGKYDLIIVDVPDPATAVLNRFYTKEFFTEVGDLLNPDGVLVIGAVSTPDLRGKAVANRNAAIYHTLDSVFSRVLPAGEHFIYFFATNSPGQISLDPVVLAERYSERSIEAEGFSAHHYQTLLEDSQLRRVNWVVRNHGRSIRAHVDGPEAGPLLPPSLEEQELIEKDLLPVVQRYFINTDFKPIGYFYTLMFWDDLTRRDRAQTFSWLLHIEPWWILPLCLVSLLTALGMRAAAKRKRNKFALGFAIHFTVFTTGLSTMTLQIALIFSFQSIYGFVYETVGLIVALFMCGLALGAFLTNRYVKHKSEIKTLATVQLSIALLAVVIAFVLPLAATAQSPAVIFVLFSMLTFGAGLINGVDFPIAVACYMTLKRDADKTAGIVYGAELFGACVGAALASAVVAPVLGIIACALFAAIANGTAFVVLFICGRLDQPWLARLIFQARQTVV